MIAVLVLASFAAGWIDAVVGGGGLILLPVLLLVPGVGAVEALGTNKAAAWAGTTASSVTYYRKVRPDLKVVVPTALFASLFSAGGAYVAAVLPGGVLTPIILVALIIAALYTVLRPELGEVTASGWDRATIALRWRRWGPRSGSTTG